MTMSGALYTMINRMKVFLTSLSLPSVLFPLIFLLSACGRVNLEWKEEVELPNGEAIIVARTAKGNSQMEIGGVGGWSVTEMTLSIPEGMGSSPPEWKSKYVPILLDYDVKEDVWSLVSTFYFCSEWINMGRPSTPYLEFQSRAGQPWRRVALENRFKERKVNLLTGPRSGGEAPLIRIDEKDRRNSEAGERFKKVVSEWKTNC